MFVGDVYDKNVPKVEGKVYLFPDVSGSMQSPVTGHREGATSKVRVIDIAALVSAAFLRMNEDSEVIPFAEDVMIASVDDFKEVLIERNR